MTRPARVRPVRTRRAHVTTLPQLLATAVETDPTGLAVVFADDTATLAELTYAELDERSTRLARLLIARGIGPEDLVAIGIPRSVDSVVAVWAVAKTGAGFVPVDPNYPADRVAHMVTDSGAVLGLTVDAVRAGLPGGVEWLAIDGDGPAGELSGYPPDPVTYADRLRPLRAEHPAYVIYTSGSTGTPKGVVVTQVGLSTLCEEKRRHLRVGNDSRTLAFASPSFDASVAEMLVAVGSAATLVVCAPTVYGGEELAALLRRERVTHAIVTPAALASVDPAGLDDLRVVVVAGDACPPELVRRWAIPVADGIRQFFDAYGPTEATVMSNISPPLTAGAPVTIGGPIRTVTEYLLDERLAPVPDGAVGELYIGGRSLARGYHNRAALTAARFVANPFDAKGSRLYRTGDLARRTVGGELEYLGRNDFQVKIRGFRIELGEIDAVLAAHETVDFAVTVGHRLPNDSTILVSYVHPAPGAAVVTEELTEAAARRLPAHMVPTAIVVLDEIPLTPVGKLDRAALPAPVLPTREFRAPAGALEELIAGVFTELLGTSDPIGAEDDFFDLGGNSLIATRVAARLGADLSTRVPARLLFEAPTVAALARRLEPMKGQGGRPPLVAKPRPERIPLSLAQQRMWFLNRFDPDSPANNIPFAIRLTGRLDVEALQAAIIDVIERHETLRTVYPAVDGTGHQVVLPLEEALPDLAPKPIAEDEIEGWLAGLALSGFDVTDAVPLRIAVGVLGTDDYVIVVVVHHIAADGVSIAPFMRDLLAAFLARRNRSRPGWPALPVQYADYALWQREVLGDEADPDSLAAEQLAYWRSVLAGLPERLDLPADRPRPAATSGLGAEYAFTVDARLHTLLDLHAQRSGASLFMVVHAALAVLLSRLSGTTDIAIGSPVAGRGERELDDLIGMFVNTLVLRTVIDPDASFHELLAQVRDSDLGAFSHADLPFERLVEVLDPVRSQAHHPLFQVALFFQNMDKPRLELPGLTAAAVDFDGAIAKFDLQLTVVPRKENGEPRGLTAAFTYATDLFDEATVAGFAERLVALFDAITTDPAQPVGDIDLLRSDERARILHDWNDTRYPVEPELLLDGYRDAVTRYPDAVAVAYEGEELTYAEFDARVNRLARLLISRDVGPEALVGLAIRRSPELVVAMYAVVAAGGAYVPLDPDHPAERIAHILDTARPACVLTTVADAVAVPEDTPVLRLDTVDLGGFDAAPVRPDELRRPLRPEHPAYVIFTSGSTGRPKGVAVSHAAIHNQITWMLAAYPLSTGDVYLQKTATTFDVSLWGYFMPLRTGAKLVVATHDGHRDPAYIAETIAAHGVTVTDFVPSMLSVFAAHAAPGACSTLQDLFVIGEALPPETVDAVRRVCDARVHNLYGPTEAAVSVTYWPAQVSDRSSVPIGLPQWNTQVYVLDARLRPVLPGVPGELYLAGEQLARGYVARPDLTADRFVANPFGDNGARMYRTGDLVVWREAEGELPARLDYLGRTDFQVKFRGQRIELGEIEAALLARPEVNQAVALVRPSELGDRLVAYAVPAPGDSIDQDALRSALAETLPAYMVPETLVTLPEFPLNASGKLDRKALPEPAYAAREFRAPATPVEEIVAEIFAAVLGVERVGADDDFFALGGNSLVATQVVARLGAAVDGRVPVRALFETPTVAGLAASVESQARERPRIPLGSVERPDRLPLSLAQQRMWFLNRFDQDAVTAGSAAYNLPFALRLTGRLDVRALSEALDDVVARHEVLRTVYPETPDGPVQVILPADAPLGVTPERVAAVEVATAVHELATTPFDVTAEVPIRVRLFEIDGPATDSGSEYVLAVVVHHIAADGSSVAPLVRDVMTAYAARTSGAAPGWSPLAVQYADYALWQRAVLGDESDAHSIAAQQIAYWRQALDDLPDLLELPADRPRPAVATLRGGRVGFRVDAETHAALNDLAHAHGATLFMVVHTALAVLLARLSGTDDVAVGTPVAGRGEAELDDLIGMFVNTVVFRTQVDRAESFAELLTRQRETDLSAYAHADIPFERLVEVLNPPRSTAHHPLFQVGLSFQNMARTSVELPDLTVRGVDAELDVSQFDLHLIVGDGYDEHGRAAGIAGHFTYATDLFDAATVEGFADRLSRILSAVIADAAVPVGDIEILTPAERGRILAGRNDTAHPTGAPATLATLLDRAVAAAPEAIALVADLPDAETGRAEVTYAELDVRVNRLARHLISLGVGPESRVALMLPRSVDLVVAMYAVAKAGGAYVPIDPDQPADRVDYILETADPVCVLTTSATRRVVAAGDSRSPAVSAAVGVPKPVVPIGNAAVLDWRGRSDSMPTFLAAQIESTDPADDDAPGPVLIAPDLPGDPAADSASPRIVPLDGLDLSALSGESVTDVDRPAPLRPSNTAYVIFTSGSTGRPKGVAVPHAAVVNQLLWKTAEFGLDADNVVLLKTAATFDLSVWEFWSAAVSGGRLVIAMADGHRDPGYLNDLIAREGVTTLHVVPSMLDTLLTDAASRSGGIANGLRRVLAIGEALPGPLAQRFRAAHRSVELFNLYGPTEAAVSITTHRVTDADAVSVPIGVPEWNSRVYVLDSRLRPVPDGASGELYLAGAQLARGYAGRADLTADRFVADPFQRGARMYRTGDLVAWNTDGELEYRGRTDFQVKVRGFRIELGEIEAALLALPEIARVAVLARQDRRGDRLVAYLVPADGEVDTAAVRSALSTVLPNYMVPSAFVVLDALPLTANGKLDRRALPEPVAETREYRAPQTPAEEALAEVIGEVLGLDRVGLDDDFFALGGDSIMSIQVVSRARARGVMFSPRDVFALRTVEALAGAAAVESAEEEPPSAGPVPLTPMAVRLLRIDPTGRGRRAVALDIPDDCTADRVLAAVQALLDRHPMLSARIETPDGEGIPAPAGGAASPFGPPVGVRIPSVVADGADRESDGEDAEPGPATWADHVTEFLPVIQPGQDFDAATTLLPTVPAEAATEFLPVVTAAGFEAGARFVRRDDVEEPDAVLVVPDTGPEASLRPFAPAANVTEVAVRALSAELDPASGHNIRFGLIAPADDTEYEGAQDLTTTLVVVATELIVDDVSWRIIVDELSAAWSGSDTHTPVPAGAATSVARALADYATDPDTITETSWWKRTLGGIPADLPAGELDPAARGRVSLVITAEGAAAVAAVAAAYHATIEEVLLAALALSLEPSQRGPAAEVVGPVVQLRADGRAVAGPEFAGAVGGFTAAYPFVLGLDDIDAEDALLGGPAAGEVIVQVKERRRTVPGRGAGYGPLRYLNPETAAELAALTQGRFAFRYRDLRPATAFADPAPADLYLDISIDATADSLLARFDYAAEVLSVEQVKDLAGQWVRALGGLAEHGAHDGVGGFTPTDFPLVRLAQNDIDRLAHDYPNLADVWPVTPLQSGMLFHALLADTSVDLYTTQFTADLSGSVDAARLREAAQAVLDRHENLRVAFAEDADGNPAQLVLNGVEVPWRTVDLTGFTAAGAEAELARITATDYADRFDMRTAPLLRFTLIRTARETYRLLATSHHILLDGWSTPLLMRDLLIHYALGPDVNIPVVQPYRDYLAWLVAQDPEAARAAWRRALAGVSEPTPLAPVDPGREIASGAGEVGFELDAEVTGELTGLAARLGVTVNTVVQAAWGLLIGRSTDRDDVIFGATVSGRPPTLPGVESMVGLFVNAIPVRVRLDATETLDGLLRRLQAEQADLFDHHYLGLSEIQDATGVGGLFDSLVVFESFPIDREGLDRASAVDGMNVTGVESVNGTHYPVTVMVSLDDRLHVSLKYLRDVFDEAAATALAQRLSALIGRFVATPEARIADVDALLDTERDALAAANATETPGLLGDATLISLFDAQVARTPQAPALYFGGTTLTYHELDVRSRALAADLADRGVGPETLVAVAMRRSIDFVVAIYAVLRAGGGYVPVDPDHPADRTAFVLINTLPVCVLTTTRDGFETRTGIPVVAIDTLAGDRAGEDFPAASPDAVAYVIHTSGSTGRPKGVMITHRQMANQFRWAQRAFPHGTGDVVLHKTPITFDISTWELFWPLQTGAAVVIAEPDGHRDPAYLSRVIDEYSVGTVHFVPSMLDAFLDADANPTVAQGYPSLRRVFAAGEALSRETATTFAALLERTELINWYGPAEATVVTSWPALETGGATVPIGTPVANTRVHVLDRQLRPVPPGAPGELYVAGVQLARGYLGAPTLTAERFVAHDGGERLYRTGDIVRWRDGALEYLGRSDFQVKLRGQRIELGEIEAVLAGHDSVRHAVVSLVRDRLVAHVVPAPGAAVDEPDLLAHARAALPAYMVPAALVVLDELPLNASGKLDRRALPMPQLSTRPYRAPSTPLEQAVADVFAAVLGVDRVGADDDFFDLGGNSLIATRAVRRLREATGGEIRVQWFFTGSTVAELARHIENSQSDDFDFDLDSAAALEVVLPIRAGGAGAPLFCLHPMYGLSWCYAGLVRYVSNRPIVGLQSPALSEDGDLPESLGEMAIRYAEEIRRVWPDGPYHLLGWSLGGVLAHEIATILQAQGARVELVAMLDSRLDIVLTDFHAVLREVLAEIGIGAEMLVGDGDVHDLSESGLATLHATLPPELVLLTPERLRRIYRSAVRAAELIVEHRPGVYRGRLDYFSAQGRESGAGNWRDYVDGEIVDYPVAAVHEEMVAPEAMAQIGPQLRKRLATGGDGIVRKTDRA
ncbi:amino acid adenylation domain-containing protein/non-ribosomal peptide synthase protein (TIGR01720 family) [Nocardia transvalensis]|uniref:Amino acid adenylation domain-containing protein/non-ribosomal peptide synthase protein (TIGR01720 family) n=1 Tax=Nocardia transvalensis TaxID=37333 RepID=A0A7W9PBC2_9NOCA|nr:non-ribosomal peptide synthetase [Nocardia transvalensis]MBB5912967.1 amino acid adenylation domain-containing protein/non-ribosomal peptide synthase protein (TIGR01720 family) [Nocardia transvalensis]